MDETLKLGLVSIVSLFVSIAVSCGGPEEPPKSLPVVIIGDESGSTNTASAEEVTETVQTSCGECARPRPWCEGDVSVAVEVTCVDGACALGEEVETDCAASGLVCDEGECVEETTDPDPPRTCDAECPPPAPTCRGVIAQVPRGTATCNPETLRCEGETYDEIRCADTGQVCSAGQCIDPPKRAFLTAALYDGNLTAAAGMSDDLAAADHLCQLEAQGAQLGGTWKAWISSFAGDAIDRIDDVGPWYLINNTTLIANNLAELATTGPRAAIRMHPNGTTEMNYGAWTGTTSSGRWDGENDCFGWSTDDYQYEGVFGVADLISADQASWTDHGPGDCDIERHLYCIEQ